MGDYRVRWEIDVEAPSPAEAACKARVMATREETTATCFEVLDGKYDQPSPLGLIEEFDVRWNPSFPHAKAYTIEEAEALDDTPLPLDQRPALQVLLEIGAPRELVSRAEFLAAAAKACETMPTDALRRGLLLDVMAGAETLALAALEAHDKDDLASNMLATLATLRGDPAAPAAAAPAKDDPLLERLEAIDDDSLLDGIIHNEKSAEATGINGEGQAEQLAYLRANGWTDEMILEAISAPD